MKKLLKTALWGLLGLPSWDHRYEQLCARFEAVAGGIFNEVAADQRLDICCLADMINHQLQSLRANTLIPIGLSHPIAYQRLALSRREIVAITRQIAHCADGFARLLEFYCPGGVIVENGPDHFQAFLYRLMRRPARTRPHIRVRSIFKQYLGVTFAPKAQDDLFCFHHFTKVGKS